LAFSNLSQVRLVPVPEAAKRWLVEQSGVPPPPQRGEPGAPLHGEAALRLPASPGLCQWACWRAACPPRSSATLRGIFLKHS